jgi:hypothetical protein
VLVLTAISFYFLLITYCHFEAKSNPKPTSTNISNNYTSEQLCMEFYGKKYLIGLIIHSANLISTNLAALIISLAFCLCIYGWLTDPVEMAEAMVQIYKAIKSTAQVVLTELWTTGQGAIRLV